jgi:signal transduction histidine kinase
VAVGSDPYGALRDDPGLRAILESSLFAKNVTFAAIVDTRDVAIAHADRSVEGQPLPPSGDLIELQDRFALQQLIEIYRGQGRTVELRQPLLLGDRQFGSIRIGVSTLLIRQDLNTLLTSPIATAFAALAIAIIVAMLLAQLLLRPIHVIRSGLTRLGRGEFGVKLNLDQSDEFGELGASFNSVSAQLSADRLQMAGQVANLESAVEHLEDAMAMVSPRGQLLFINPAMRALLPEAAPGALLTDVLPPDHPARHLAEQTLVTRQSHGPLSVKWGDPERLVMSHAIKDPRGDLVGVMLIARNLEYLGQVQSTIRYSRKLAALGRLSAGVAHEVKNPLNAMMIHLELLRQRFAPPAPARGAARGAAAAVADTPVDAQALSHVDTIANEIKRLDEVVQGFLKFARPEDLKLQPVGLADLMGEVIGIVRPEADRAHVTLVSECQGAPDVNGDPAMLRQAFLNLALNACQAMPDGGSLRIGCQPAAGRHVAVAFADTGVGIDPKNLPRIFDLYFTTRSQGSGIGLSMVFRTIQMHDGEIEVQSTPGAGTTFTVLLPQA